MILKMDKGGIWTNGLEDKKIDDNEQGLMGDIDGLYMSRKRGRGL